MSEKAVFRGMAPLLSTGTEMSSSEYEQWLDEHSWSPSRDAGLTLVSDLRPADWLRPGLVPESFMVNMMTPSGFEAYARIFFPFGGHGTDESFTWRSVVEKNRRTFHALVERETIDVGNGGEPEYFQTDRTYSPEQLAAMLAILARHSGSTTCWFLLWDGFGGTNRGVLRDDLPKVAHHWRNYHLLEGPLESLRSFADNPSYVWPQDRSWCLCTDTDFEWSYIAGTHACIAELLTVPAIDCVETELENPACSGMDVINDPHGAIRRR